jgi:hypothetical protein
MWQGAGAGGLCAGRAVLWPARMARSGSWRGFPCQIPGRAGQLAADACRSPLPWSVAAESGGGWVCCLSLDGGRVLRAGGRRGVRGGGCGSAGRAGDLFVRAGGGTWLRGGTAGGGRACLGPRARAAPGGKMIDGASCGLRGMRPLSLFGRSAWPCAAGPGAAGGGLAGAGRGAAPSGESGSAACLPGRAKTAAIGGRDGLRRRSARRGRARPGWGGPGGRSCGPGARRRACRPGGP